MSCSPEVTAMTFLAAQTRDRKSDRPAAVASPLVIREETRGDFAAREALLNAALGPARFEKTSERLREGRKPARGLALAASLNGKVVGTVRLWHIDAGGAPALLLGPLAVSAEHRSLGIGAALMRSALRCARMRGHKAVLLVGDAAYYERFGFSRARAVALEMPGPVDDSRFLALELAPGALGRAAGKVTPACEFAGAPALRMAA